MILALSILAIFLVTWVCGIIYLATSGKVCKWFFHNVMKWHLPNNEESFDGCSIHSTCKFCGKEIMQDSQGNWF